VRQPETGSPSCHGPPRLTRSGGPLRLGAGRGRRPSAETADAERADLVLLLRVERHADQTPGSDVDSPGAGDTLGSDPWPRDERVVEAST
jgi:hypothetical protein